MAVVQAKMSPEEVCEVLTEDLYASSPRENDGARIHVVYDAFCESSAQAMKEAEEGMRLGIPKGHYTGRLVEVKTTKSGDTVIVMYVELERDNKYRSFNVDQGSVRAIKVLGK